MPDDTPWWVYIDDQYAKNGPNLIALGPYPNEAAAKQAGDNASIVDGILQDGGVDCWWEDREPSHLHAKNFSDYALEIILIDLTDEDHTG